MIKTLAWDSVLALLLSVLLAAPAWADPAAPPEPVAKPKKKRRYKHCACARPRLLREGKEVVLDDSHAVSAWIREGRVELAAFERIKEGDKFRTQSVPVPFVVEDFDVSVFGEVQQSPHKLQRVKGAGTYEPHFLLGLLRTKSQLPADVVRARLDAPFSSSEAPQTPKLSRLWLSPYRHMVHPSCGPSDTHRVHFELDEDSPPLAGFVVVVQGKATLIDERHARTFGIGRVAPCDQGLELGAPVARRVRVIPVGWDMSVADPFVFSVAAQDGAHPELIEAPSGASDDEEKNPFKNPPPDPLEELLNDEKDTVALGVMVFVVFGAAAIAGVLWRAWRRRRIEEELACPVCDASLTLNLMDPASDGMFCPSCGKASVFVTFEPDGSPRARVYKHS